MKILCSISLSGEGDEQGLNTGFRFLRDQLAVFIDWSSYPWFIDFYSAKCLPRGYWVLSNRNGFLAQRNPEPWRPSLSLLLSDRYSLLQSKYLKKVCVSDGSDFGDLLACIPGGQKCWVSSNEWCSPAQRNTVPHSNMFWLSCNHEDEKHAYYFPNSEPCSDVYITKWINFLLLNTTHVYDFMVLD